MLSHSPGIRLSRVLLLMAALCCPAVVACSSSPTSPLEVSQVSLGAAYDVFVRGGTAYVSNNEGIAVLDLSDIRNPRRTGQISESSSGGTVAGFHVSGDTLFAYGDRFSMYTVEGDSNPRIISSFTGRGFVTGAGTQGQIAYLAFLHGGLEAVDLKDAAKPTSMGYAPFTGQVNDMVVHESVAYVANSATGLVVFDV